MALVRDGAGLGVGAGWNWAEAPREGAGVALVDHLTISERIVELDPLRAWRGDDDERAGIGGHGVAEDCGKWPGLASRHLSRRERRGRASVAGPSTARPGRWRAQCPAGTAQPP